MAIKSLRLPWHIETPGHHNLTIRQLELRDCETFITHLHELSFDDFRDRFNGVVSDHWLESYVRQSLTEATVFGAFHGNRLIAVAELHRAGHAPDGFGEAAFSVASDWRRNGIGTVLITVVLEAARVSGVHTVIVETGRDNTGMRQLARKFGATMRHENWMSVGHIDVDEGLRMAENSIAQFSPILFKRAENKHLEMTPRKRQFA